MRTLNLSAVLFTGLAKPGKVLAIIENQVIPGFAFARFCNPSCSGKRQAIVTFRPFALKSSRFFDGRNKSLAPDCYAFRPLTVSTSSLNL